MGPNPYFNRKPRPHDVVFLTDTYSPRYVRSVSKGGTVNTYIINEYGDDADAETNVRAEGVLVKYRPAVGDYMALFDRSGSHKHRVITRIQHDGKLVMSEWTDQGMVQREVGVPAGEIIDYRSVSEANIDTGDAVCLAECLIPYMFGKYERTLFKVSGKHSTNGCWLDSVRRGGFVQDRSVLCIPDVLLFHVDNDVRLDYIS